MHARRNNYERATNLTDDFRRLKSTTPTELDYSWEVDNCPICLDVHDEPRTLACKHTFCTLCLQYTIDRTPSHNKHYDRGFECVICGYFTKFPNYSIPRCQWAGHVPKDYRFPQSVPEADDNNNGEEESKQPPRKERLKENTWFIKWKVSTFPKSYLLSRCLNPYKRLNNRYVFSNTTSLKDDESELAEPHSDILAVTFYEDSVILYDDGLHEVQIYNSDMTLTSCFRENNVFDLAVLGSSLYMTIPGESSVHVYDLANKIQLEPLHLTTECFGMDSFNDNLAVLLCDEGEKQYTICVLNSLGIIGDCIVLKGGRLKFKCPRELAMCAMTRLAYVSDEEAGIVKCFRFDGSLSWERLVYGAGALAVHNGYLMVGREYTSSIDVLIGGGQYNGRLQSLKYTLFEPHSLTISQKKSEIVVVDGNQMIHQFILHRKDELVKERTSVCVVL